MKTSKKTLSSILAAFMLLGTFSLHGQGLKDKMKGKLQKDNSAIYECGYVYQPTTKDKLNPMKGLQKALGGAVTEGGESNLGNISISVFYQAHQHPQEIMRYPTATPGWETCGDAVYLGMTNKSGVGLSQTDGKVMMDGQEIAKAGAGTYYQGFKPELRGEKQVQITSSNGDKIELAVKPGAPLEILSIDGKAKGEEILIDGTKDIVIEVENGDADPKSQLHVQMICKLVGTPITYDIIVAKAKNTITVPKEAFKNFEGSPSPYIKGNTLIINRVTEEIIEGTDAGAIRTISAYMDWWPVSVGGDLVKGNVLTMGFDTTKNTKFNINMQTEGEYNFIVSKDGPYISPPVKSAKKVAIASFVIRGNLTDQMVKETVVLEEGKFKSGLLTTNSSLPAALNNDAAWFGLSDLMYQNLAQQLQKEMGWELVPLNQITSAEAYKHAKSVKNASSHAFVEVGAGGTKRILTTSQGDLFQDLSITFPGNFVSQRLIQELDVDMVIAITIDLSMSAQNQSLDSKAHIVAFAPNVSYKTAAKYFSMTATTEGASFSEDESYILGQAHQKLYEKIKGNEFEKGFIEAMKALSAKENDYPAYEAIWENKN